MLSLIFDILCCLIVLISTAACIVLTIRKAGKDPSVPTKTHTFRYFTTLSNVLSAAACIPTLICALLSLKTGSFFAPEWVTLLKYTGTVSVCVTFLTVMFFLGPTQGYKKMLSGTGFFMHLLGPVLAAVSLVLLERVNMISFAQSLCGMLPTVFYGTLYTYMVMFLGEKKGGWEDFYGFNMGNKWYLSMAAMIIGTFAVCGLLRVGHNLLLPQ